MRLIKPEIRSRRNPFIEKGQDQVDNKNGVTNKA
jgi:hypothetical protein